MGRDRRGLGEKKLEQYGVWVKAEPREVPGAPPADETIGLSDLDTPVDAGGELPDISDESPLTTEEEKLLDELETEMEPSAAGAVGAAGAVDLPELTLEPESGDEVEVALSDSLPAEEHFDDLQALEDQLASVTSGSAAAAATAAAGHSPEILARIEEELRSIRTDLTELKKELAGLRRPGAPAAKAAPSAEPGGGRAFFDEDEDETIALTGDELDNILNTADITEGTAEAAAPDDDITSADSLHLEPLDEPAAAAALEVPAAEPGALEEDILGYETPILEEDRVAPAESLDEDLAELEPEEGGVDLAADLVLEEVPPAGGAKAPGQADALADLDLEALPEIETDEPAAAAPAARQAKTGKESSLEVELEPAELDTAELEPAEMEAADLESADLEPIEELEDAAEAPAEAGEPVDQVDLEALARESAEANEELPLDLDTGPETAELEPVAEEAADAAGIEIDFETDKSAPAEAEPVDELLEVEEVAEVEPAQAARPAAREQPSREAARPAPVSSTASRQDMQGKVAVPDDLKEEIRSVLKYMDHLLEALPDDKVEEFARSEYFAMYNKLFKELGLGD